MSDGPNGGTADIATDGRLRQLEIDIARLDERVKADRDATELQADEYARRLKDLNGEYERDRQRQANYLTRETYLAEHKPLVDKISGVEKWAAEVPGLYVTVDKYEDKLQAEAEARSVALTRTNEKLDDYVQRSELRQREIETTISTLSVAAAEAKRIAEDQGRQTRAEADDAERRQKNSAAEASRRQTRNITVMGIALAFAVGVANLLPVILK